MRHAVLLVAGTLLCSSASAAASTPNLTRLLTQPLSRLNWMAQGANPAHPWMYATSGRGDAIAIFDLARFGTPKIGQLSQGLDPNGMALDANGTLYVANWNGGNPGGDVTIFPAGATVPSLTLTQGLSVPITVAVDSGGDVYVVDRGNQPRIVVFPPGQTTPSQFIESSEMEGPANLAFDSAQNLFITDNNKGIFEVPFGSTQLELLNLTGLNNPSGITIDPLTGDYFVSDLALPQHVVVYAPGDVNPIRKLDLTIPACDLASGAMKGEQYIFVPDCAGPDVWVFKHDARRPHGTLYLRAPGNPPSATQIVFKAANVP